jgi:predicted DCC family thiol-disulfide oxidoreductase YuxK
MAVAAADDAPVLLYDAGCALCSATVQIILRHDRRGSLRFAALESRFGGGVLVQHPELRGVDSAVWVDLAQGQVFARSDATLRVAAYLGGWWRVAAVFRMVPRRIRDWGYDLVARHRHLLMGRAPHCVVAPAGMQHRFLNEEYAAPDA